MLLSLQDISIIQTKLPQKKFVYLNFTISYVHTYTFCEILQGLYSSNNYFD